MKQIYYKSSEGVVINLIAPPYMMLTDTDIFNWEWSYETAGTNYPYITAFENKMISKAISVVVSGATEEEFSNNLEHFDEVTDRDVRLNQAGRLYVGNYFRDCFITGSSKGKVLKTTKTTLTLTLVSEEGDWKNEQPNSYQGLSGGKYLNNYAVPSVTSNSENLSYYFLEDIDSEFRFMTPYDNEFDVSDYDAFIIKTLTGDIQYRTSGGYTVVHPADCPYTIDCENVNNLYIKASSFVIMEYTMDTNNDTTHISWQPYYVSEYDGDLNSTFLLDLGAPVELKSITGLEVGCVVENLQGATISLEVSPDNINWTEVDSVSMPLSQYNYETLEKEWNSNYPEVRYIRVIGSEYGSSVPRNTRPFELTAKAFLVEAHFSGEEQNLALSSIYSKTNVLDVSWNSDEVLSFELQGYGPHSLLVTLPAASNIIKIGNIIADTTSTSPIEIYVDYMDADGNTYNLETYSITNTSYANIDLDLLDLENVSEIMIRATGSVRYRCADFQILEEQQQAPHRYILNENYVPSDAIIKIYGPTQAPSIMIGNNQYGAEDLTLLADEYLEVNTKEETLKHYTGEDSWNNVFYRRLDSTFEKIEIGTSEITWEGPLRVDIELLNARSGPKWN